jgi:hypothetical protein
MKYIFCTNRVPKFMVLFLLVLLAVGCSPYSTPPYTVTKVIHSQDSNTNLETCKFEAKTTRDNETKLESFWSQDLCNYKPGDVIK